MCLFVSFSIGASQYSYINRTFELLLRGAFEKAIIIIDDQGEIKPYFDEEILEEEIEEYFALNLPRYVRSYEYYYYFSYSDKGGYCINHDCDAIKISLKANINDFFIYNKAKTFFIREGIYQYE